MAITHRLVDSMAVSLPTLPGAWRVTRRSSAVWQRRTMRQADQREAAEMLRRLLDAVGRGELTADTPAERRNLRRLEGMLAALEGMDGLARRTRRSDQTA